MVAVVHFAAPRHDRPPLPRVLPARRARRSRRRARRRGRLGPRRRHRAGPPQLEAGAAVFGHGLGTGKTAPLHATPGAITDPKTGAPIIFDDQYLNSLVSIGFLGLLGVLWFVWGAVAPARRRRRAASTGPASDLVAACAVACAGFGAGMLTFDAFSFVQCTLIFFLIAALGLRSARARRMSTSRRAMRTELGAGRPNDGARSRRERRRRAR